MPSVVLATRNKGKIKELSALLGNFGITVQGLDAFPEIGEIPETGNTFEENARIKAEAVSRATGLTALADDSGLAVEALGGAPGVYSARYSGPEATDETNNAKLLAALDGVADANRTARFVCVVVAMTPDGQSIQARGEWEGVIARERSGSEDDGVCPGALHACRLVFSALQKPVHSDQSRKAEGVGK
ncbi:MAG: non-canonical purine NTP pyrophosphatase [Proteobacteria bacterium]|nr:non-canonical purine NTP pyrophosphatase [Pseudomonadota bacterium]